MFFHQRFENHAESEHALLAKQGKTVITEAPDTQILFYRVYHNSCEARYSFFSHPRQHLYRKVCNLQNKINIC